MTKIETMGIMAILKAAYPMYYKDQAKEDLKETVNLWHEMFADDDVQLIKAAVKAYIASSINGFPPVIGQIKAQLNKITTPEQMTEQQAWSLVSRAIQNSAYHASEEYEKLPMILKQVVGSPMILKEWSQLPVETVQSVISSNFQRSYKVKAATVKEYQALPSDVRQLIASTTNNLMIE